jgi:hypothetical protein
MASEGWEIRYLGERIRFLMLALVMKSNEESCCISISHAFLYIQP